MAFKQQYKGLSRASDGKGFTLSELEEKTKKEKIKSKEQALKLPQIEKPGFDYEMDQDMSYPGGERGRDYDEDGLKDLKKDGMSRKSGSYLSDADVKRKQKKADKKFSKVSAKNSDKKNLRKAKAGLKVEGQIVDKEIKDRKKNNKS